MERHDQTVPRIIERVPRTTNQVVVDIALTLWAVVMLGLIVASVR